MATTDVPGANKRNRDKLDVGCWAEDDKGTSLMLVVGKEDKRVVFDMYDLSTDMFYRDAMMEDEFKAMFSKSGWTWHDKTEFPWDRVMKRFRRPVPVHTDVEDQLSAAARVAESLNLRGRKLTEDVVESQMEALKRKGYAIIDAIANALRS